MNSSFGDNIEAFVASVIIPWGLILLYLGVRAWGQPRDKDRAAYWQNTIEGLDEDPDVFFGQVYKALKEGLASRDVQLSGMGFGPTRLFETRSVLSARPLYLQAKYKHLSYYLYLGQTPTGMFLSSRVYSKYVRGEGLEIGRVMTFISTVRSAWSFLFFQRQTMFEYDAAIIFQESVHSIVLRVLDTYIEERKLKPLEEYERRPILHSFYASAYPPRPQQVWAMPVTTPMTTAMPVTEPSAEPANAMPATNTSMLSSDLTSKTLPLEADEPITKTTHKLETVNQEKPLLTSAASDSSTRFEADGSREMQVMEDVQAVLSSSTHAGEENQAKVVSQSFRLHDEEPESLELEETAGVDTNEAPPRSGRILPL